MDPKFLVGLWKSHGVIGLIRGHFIPLMMVMWLCGLPNLADANDLPALEYHFDEGSGVAAINTGSLGSAADGALVDTTYTTDTPFGSGTALSFPNTGGAVNLPAVLAYEDASGPLNHLTLEGWVKPAETDTFQILWDDQKKIALWIRKGGVQFKASSTDYPDVLILGGQFQGNIWTHIAVVYDGTAITIYINGQDSCVSAQMTGTLPTGLHAPVIGGGGRGTTPRYYNGLLDEFRVHLRALDRSELANGFFASTTPLSCAVCGDGVVESPEECELPGSLCSNGVTCSASCTCPLTYDGTTWDIEVQDMSRVVVGSDVYTFLGGTFTSDVATQEGCLLDSFTEQEVIIRNAPQLRFTANMSCPNGEARRYEGNTPDLQSMGGWIRKNDVTVNVIAGLVRTDMPPPPPPPTSDVVEIVKATWSSKTFALSVQATSSAAPTAVLTLVGFGNLVYNSVTNLYQKSFNNVLSNPGSVTVTSNMGGSATATVP